MRQKSLTKHILILMIFMTLLILTASCRSETFDEETEGALYPVKKGRLYGYVNRAGEEIIQPQFDLAQEFSEGLAAVMPDILLGTWGFINEEGKMVINPQFEFVQRFSEGLAPVFFDENWGYINSDGEVVVEPQYYNTREFSEGMAAVSILPDPQVMTDRWGYIDTSGNIVIEPEYIAAGQFVDGLAPIDKLSTTGFINKDNELVFELPEGVGASGHFSEGLAAASDFQMEFEQRVCGSGYIDSTGEWVIEPQFCNAGAFSSGLAAVGVRNEDETTLSWGYIDNEGTFVIDAEYLLALDFYHGLARVITFDQQSGYIDKDGNWVFIDDTN